MLQWRNESSELNLIKMLCRTLRELCNELKQRSIEELIKIPPQQCNRLLKSHRKQAIAAKSGSAILVLHAPGL